MCPLRTVQARSGVTMTLKRHAIRLTEWNPRQTPRAAVLRWMQSYTTVREPFKSQTNHTYYYHGVPQMNSHNITWPNYATGACM